MHVPRQRCKFTNYAFCSKRDSLNNKRAPHAFPQGSRSLERNNANSSVNA